MALNDGGLSAGGLELVFQSASSAAFLDDWEDGNLTSSREAFADLAFEETVPTTSEYDAGTTRVPFSLANGSPSVSDGELTWGSQEAGNVQFENGQIDFSDGLTWEARITSQSSNSFQYLSFVAQSDTHRDGYKELNDGYDLQITSSLELEFSGLSVSAPSTPYVVKIVRDSGGSWELFTDGNEDGTFDSRGTTTDTTYTTGQYAGFGDSGGGGGAVDWWKLY